MVTNNIILNCGGQGVEFTRCSQGDTEISYNCVYQTSGAWQNVPNPGPGNIFIRPGYRYQGPVPGFCYLDPNSPCIDTGNPRPVFNDPNGTRSDMGAFPFTVGMEIPDNDDIFINSFTLKPVYPNPFNSMTNLVFTVPGNSLVSLKIFNSLGQVVDVLESSTLPAGSYTRNWDAADFASGVYFAELITGSHHQTQRLILIK